MNAPTPLRIGGIGRITGLNSCGKFDPKASVNAMFDQIEQLISTLESVPAAILSSLPGYIICRAKPGLCQLMQDYTTRLEGHFALHLRTCESAIQAAIDGENPFSDWITVATGEVWKTVSIHAPVKGANAKNIFAQTVIDVSIHAPVKGAKGAMA